MKLISEIIDILSSEEPDLTNALIKTKVLLYRLGQKDLIGWVNSELNGYKDDDDLPAYRILPAVVLVNASNIAWQATSHQIPLAHLKKHVRDWLEKARFQQSIGVLEELAKGKSVVRRIPMEMIPLLNKGLANDFQIQSAWCEISKTSLIQALVEVRSRLLDFMLELNKEFSGEMTDEEAEAKIKSKSVDPASMFSGAFFGDNATVVIGDANRLQISNKISKGNFTELAEELKKHDVSEDDIMKLEGAIAKDEGCNDHKKKIFGPSVKAWITEMIGKAVNTTWQIGIGTAGNLLAAGLQSFYGWR
jgi:hypothetical protein